METFAVHTGFGVPVPLETAHRPRARAQLAGVAAALLLLLSYGVPRLMTDRASKPQAASPAPPAASASAAAPATHVKPPFDVGAAIEKARHAVTRVPGVSGALEVRDPGYQARFDQTGYSYRPARAVNAMSVALTAIERGNQSLALDVGAWHASGNVVGRSVSDGMREQVTSRDGGLEWDVVLAHPPTGTGPLTIGADLNGVVGDPTRVDANTAWRLDLVGGSTVKLGETIVKDATGAELYRALPAITAGRIALVVPAAVLTHATYPLTVDPSVSQPVPLATGALINDPSIATDGSNYFVVWTQEVENFGDFNIYGARVSADGTFVQPVGKISNTTAGKSSVVPDVAWNGSEYLVVWQFNYADNDVDIYSQRVSSTGALIGGTGVVSQPAGFQQHATVAAAGSTFYVTWQDERSGNSDIYGGRITTAGSRLDGDGIAVASGSKNETLPDVAWNGTNFLVAYQYEFSTSDDDVHARLVNSSAVPVGSDQTISGGGALEQDPAVSSNGSDYLVVWEDTRNSATSATDIYGARVSAFGTVTTGGIAISNTAGNQTDPAVAYNGTYLVAWLDLRVDYDLRGARVAGNGTVQDTNGFDLAVVADDDFTPALSRGPSGHWAVDYESFDGSTSHVLHRTIAPK